MNKGLKKKALGLALLATISFRLSASSDMVSCQWGTPGCSLAGTPWLDVNNDTRDNLLRIVSAHKHFKLPLYPLPEDEKISREAFFGYHLNPATQSDAPPNNATADKAEMDKLNDALRRLGVTVPQAKWDSDQVDSRSISNNPDSAAAFINALIANDSLHPTRRQSLAAARVALLNSGGHMPEGHSILKAGVVLPGAAGEFRAYLGAAEAFYRGDYASAAQAFSQLSRAQQPWVSETARYMMMRVSLNQSTASATDQYGLFDISRVDGVTARQALNAAQDYLTHYPDGRYAKTTRGMLRRIYWYLQRPDDQATLYQQALDKAASPEELLSLVAESDSKLQSQSLPGGKTFIAANGAPLLNFTQNLRWLRASESKDSGSPMMTPAKLKQLSPLLASDSYPGLNDYLQLAWRFWQAGDYAGLISDIKPDYRVDANDIVGFSRQILYGASLMAVKRWDAAAAHWRKLLAMTGADERGQLIQMKLAATLVSSRQLPVLLAADSAVTNLRLRSLLLKTRATPVQLRQQAINGRNAQERTIALHTLLMRDLLNQRYGDWLKDRELEAQIGGKVDPRTFGDVNLAVFNWQGKDAEPGYTCPSLFGVVQTLAKNPRAPRALNCLGEFSRLTSAAINVTFERGGNDALDIALAGTPDLRPLDRQSVYRQVIANPNASAADKSFALYRAVRCYAPSGYNDCGGKEVSKAVRRQWFNQLKQHYSKSPWAASLKYYW